MTHTIIANAKGSRSIEISDEHLKTIHKYQLLSHLVGSTGVIDESVLDKLKFNVRSLLEGEAGKDKALLDLCLDVIYNQNMKAIGLQNLIKLYNEEKELTNKSENSDNSENPELSESPASSETEA